MLRTLAWLGGGAGSLVLLAAIVLLLVGPGSVPAAQIDASVDRSASALRQARSELPVARLYPEPLHDQQNGSLCGPTSMVNVLRSLETGVGDAGVGDEFDVLEGTGMCRTGVCLMGLTLDEMADLARRRWPGTVTVFRDLSVDEFRRHMRASNDPAVRYIVNFHRAAIFDGGGGHHSPIGGYLEASDQVLVLDVNAHYGPWIVELERLYAATDTLDGDHKRGLLRLEVGPDAREKGSRSTVGPLPGTTHAP